MASKAALAVVHDEGFAIRTPAVREVFDHWDRRRAGRAFPSRRDIDPTALRTLLPFLMLVDVEPSAAPRFRFRLVGTSICRHYGADYTGRRLDELDLDGHGPAILAQYASVVAERRPRCDVLRYVMERGRTRAYERLLLPLSEDGAAVTAILGAQYDFTVQAAARGPSSGRPSPS